MDHDNDTLAYLPKITRNWTISDWKADTNYAMAIAGSRFQGKSTFLEYMWRECWEGIFDMIVLFTDNPQAEAYDFLSEEERELVFPEFNSALLKEFDYFQNSTKNLLKVLYIFDDCSMHNKNNDMLNQLYLRGRNINSSIVFSTQYHLNFSTAARANFDFLVLFDLHGNETREKVVKVFLKNEIPINSPIRMNKSQKEELLIKWFEKNTSDHQMIVMNMRDKVNKLSKFKTPLSVVRKNKK